MTSSWTSLLPIGSEDDLPIPFTDLSIQWRQIEGKALPDIQRLFQSGAFSLGPFVAQFERAAANYLGVAHAIGVNSGTSALHLALIVAGIGPGDKVLVPSYTFVATAWAVLYVGATPVLCDIEEKSANIDLADAERRLDGAVKAIIPVHLYGQPADMAAVMAFAARHRLVVIEDAAQAIGARFDGRCLGTFGLCGCYSFYPAKNLGAAGEAGLIVTADEAIARRLRALRHHAQSERYVHTELGYNYRMEGIQGLILGHKLPLLDSWTEIRRKLAQAYHERLVGLPLTLPEVVHDDHVFHLYVVRSKDRDRLRDYMRRAEVETGLHYPVPLHAQPALARFVADARSFPVADRYARECLSLPLFVGMTERQLDHVCQTIRRFFGRSQRPTTSNPNNNARRARSDRPR
jgi:dTDP-4-amino-4,6-dideoxygalactose transaminase